MSQAGSGLVPGLVFPEPSQPEESVLLPNKLMHLEFRVPTAASYTNQKDSFGQAWVLDFGLGL